MRIPRDTTRPFPVLLLEPDTENADQLASRMEAAGFKVRIEGSAHSALQTLQTSFFFALVIVADLDDKDCLAALDALRRKAASSWMIVAAAHCDAHACKLIHRRGGDACIAAPISAEDLIARLDAFRIRVRPSF